jgi:hypothetical protein
VLSVPEALKVQKHRFYGVLGAIWLEKVFARGIVRKSWHINPMLGIDLNLRISMIKLFLLTVFFTQMIGCSTDLKECSSELEITLINNYEEEILVKFTNKSKSDVTDIDFARNNIICDSGSLVTNIVFYSFTISKGCHFFPLEPSAERYKNAYWTAANIYNSSDSLIGTFDLYPYDTTLDESVKWVESENPMLHRDTIIIPVETNNWQ